MVLSIARLAGECSLIVYYTWLDMARSNTVLPVSDGLRDDLSKSVHAVRVHGRDFCNQLEYGKSGLISVKKKEHQALSVIQAHRSLLSKLSKPFDIVDTNCVH
jgi:hypothetical protein